MQQEVLEHTKVAWGNQNSQVEGLGIMSGGSYAWYTQWEYQRNDLRSFFFAKKNKKQIGY